MGIILNQLYRLSDRDLGAPYGRVYLPPEATATAGAATLSAVVQVQTDRPVLLTNLTALMLPGAAQTLTHGFLEMGPNNVVSAQRFIAIFVPQVGLPAATRIVHNWTGEIIVPPGFFIRARGEFNAGAAANFVSLQAMGLSIPLGTMQLP